jgi:hypothetical protein
VNTHSRVSSATAFFGALIVDQRLVGGSRGNKRGNGGIVECAWQAEADFVQPSDGIVGEERIGAADQRQMMA